MVRRLDTVKKVDKSTLVELAKQNPQMLIREIHLRSFYEFLKFFWPEYSATEFQTNWHILYICNELQKIAERVGAGLSKEHDLLINVPPGSTKTAMCSIFFPIWCWTRWYWMRFITLSYSADLSLESAEYSRDLIKSERFKMVYPELDIKQDKDKKSNFRITYRKFDPKTDSNPRILLGGGRYSTSVGGTLTGFHGHILLWDDAIDPKRSASPTELINTNTWLDQTLPTRIIRDKAYSAVTIGIMQRLSQNDPAGHWLERGEENLKHICIPGEITHFRNQVKPKELIQYYQDDLMDPVRLGRKALKDWEVKLGQYGYAGQIGQFPVPPTGGMFRVDNFVIIDQSPSENQFVNIVRYWDKAATKEKIGRKIRAAYTVGTKMGQLRSRKWVVLDVRRGRWSTDERERIIRQTAELDGQNVKVYYEQEPGSGGKESAQATTLNLAGYSGHADLPKGDKVYRADPYSVQVNEGNVYLLRAEWNYEFIEEHRFFPFSTYKDQVDSAAGAFSKLTTKKLVRILAPTR